MQNQHSLYIKGQIKALSMEETNLFPVSIMDIDEKEKENASKMEMHSL